MLRFSVPDWRSSSLSMDADTASLRPRRAYAVKMGKHPYLVMLLWGVVIALLGALTMLAITPIHWPIMESRAVNLRASLAVLEQGGPLLLGRNSLTGSFYAVGAAEQGIYVYFPLLSHLFGVADPVSMVRYSYITLFGLTVAIYPLIVYRLTYSLLAGIAAPLTLLTCVLSLGFSDIYWLPAWGVLTLLPLIYLLARDWPRFGLPALVSISLAAGWLSSIRPDSGLAIVIPAAIVLLLRRWQWWRVLPALALLVVAYISINTFVFTAIREHRDQRIGTNALEREQSAPHIWHTMYIGLGYLPNDYDIRYNDNVAIARVQHDAPGTRYLSSRYNTVLRKAYFSVLRHHPIEVIKQYAAKALVTAADTAPYLLIVLLTMPAMLLGLKQRIRRRWILLTIPAIVVAFLPTMDAIPTQTYEQGLYGVIGVVGILGVCWTLALAEGEARARGGVRPMLAVLRIGWSTPGEKHDLHRRIVGISGVAFVILTVLVVGGHFIRRNAERWQGGPSGVLIDSVGPSPGVAPRTYSLNVHYERDLPDLRDVEGNTLPATAGH